MPEKGDPEKEKKIIEILASGYDAFHIHTSFWQGFWLEAIAKEVGIPKIIVHSHSTSIAGVEDIAQQKQSLKRHFDLREKLSPEIATDFWACSKEAGEWLFGSKIQKQQIHLVKNAIDVESYAYNKTLREKLRSQLGISDSFVVGTLGGFSYAKNPLFLVKVFELFHSKHADSKLLLIGDGSQKKLITNYLCENNLEECVSILGFQSEVSQYLQAMDCYLLPSLFEGLGISLLEAASTGLPCLASNNIPQEVENIDTVTRLPLNLQTWVQALEEIFLIASHRESGVTSVRRAGYDVRLQVKKLEEMYLQ